MASARKFSKGDPVILAGIWNDDVDRGDGPSIFVTTPATIGALGKSQGYAVEDDAPTRIRLTRARDMHGDSFVRPYRGAGRVFHADDIALAVAEARKALRDHMKRDYKRSLDMEDRYGGRHAESLRPFIESRGWETCPIVVKHFSPSRVDDVSDEEKAEIMAALTSDEGGAR